MAGHPRSRWLFLSISLATAVVCVRLGVWQLSRLAQRRASNAVATAALARPPVVLPGGPTPAPGVRVRATGRFDLEHQFVLRGRAHDGAPGVEIGTPFTITGRDTAILVDRGFVPSDNAMAVDLFALRDTGVRTIGGIAFPLATDPDSGAPVTAGGAETWHRFDLNGIRHRLPYPVAGVALWQEKDSTTHGLPIRLGAPALSEGPHLNYAIQWFAFALIFGGGGIFYTFRKREERTHSTELLTPGPPA